jgi:hypothetical protein
MNVCKLLLCCLTVTTICSAQIQDSIKWNFSAWGWLTYGRVESSTKEPGLAVRDYNFIKEILSDIDAGIKTTVTMPKGLKGRFHLGVTSAYMIGDDYSPNTAEYLRRRTVPYLIDAAIEKTYKTEQGEFFGEFGYFPVKYNPQARNLGEYLFRSGTYYPVINSGFELADKEKLIGLHGALTRNISEVSKLKADVFFSTDMRDYPVHDFSLSYILNANLRGLLDISVGAMHAHLLSLDKRKVTPYYDDTLFPKVTGNRIFDAIYPNYPDTGDTVIYTFKGTKVIGRLTFDPKVLFGGERLGKEDLKIYCEMAILGVKNYPLWYENITERMPIMCGINLPTNQFASYCVIPAIAAFALEDESKRKLISGAKIGGIGVVAGVGSWLLDHFLQCNTKADFISFEVEHNPSPYVNTYEYAWKSRSPLPYTPGRPYKNWDVKEIDTLAPITNDDWKWSLYASRKFGHFRISGQIASDHMIRIPYMVGPPTNSRYTEITPRSWDWYWMLRVMYMF